MAADSRRILKRFVVFSEGTLGWRLLGQYDSLEEATRLRDSYITVGSNRRPTEVFEYHGLPQAEEKAITHAQ